MTHSFPPRRASGLGWRLGAAGRCWPRLPGVLRHVRASGRAAALRRRQADAECGHRSSGCLLARLAAEGMTMKSRPNDDAMADLYRDDPALALEVINAILEDGDQGELLTVPRQVAQASGGVQAVAEQAHLNPTQLYRTLSSQGNPALNSLLGILKAMGLRARKSVV